VFASSFLPACSRQLPASSYNRETMCSAAKAPQNFTKSSS